MPLAATANEVGSPAPGTSPHDIEINPGHVFPFGGDVPQSDGIPAPVSTPRDSSAYVGEPEFPHSPPDPEAGLFPMSDQHFVSDPVVGEPEPHFDLGHEVATILDEFGGEESH